MTTIEVLAPVRLETRYVAPGDRTDGGAGWLLRLRVYPDEFSIARTFAPPTPDELDRLTEVVAAMAAIPPLDEPAAFSSFAASVGAARALGLWRRCVSAGVVDRSGEVAPDGHLHVHAPVGLPTKLQVWFIHTDGTREPAATLTPDLSAIAADLDVESFQGSAEIQAGSLPETWWLSYDRATQVGLGVDIELGAAPPDLEALVVLGLGDTDAATLVDTHVAGSRIALLPPGTPTNTVEGEPTTDFGDHAETLYPLLDLDPATQPATVAALTALTGRLDPDALPMLGGEADLLAPGRITVQGYWPVLWGRMLRDVISTDRREPALAHWARRYLAVEGSRPSIRVGAQPYGLLPASTYAAWVPEPGDALAPLEDAILRWATRWRDGAASAAEAAHDWVEGADTDALLDVLGLHAPSRYWQVRPVAEAAVVTADRLLSGLAPFPPSEWDAATAGAWRGWPVAALPIAPASRPGQVPGAPADLVEDPDVLRSLCLMGPQQLYFEPPRPLGLVGHLVREAMIAARAIVGQANEAWATAGRVDLAAVLPLADEATYSNHVQGGGDLAVSTLESSGDPDAELVAKRFLEVQKALLQIADLWEESHEDLVRATRAALDTAAFRADPWLTGVADRRLQSMATEGAPFKLGAYGWVDAPAPYAGTGALAPGPTSAGLLHAPSHEQALTAALLRDAALRTSRDGRWQLSIDSAKVRASIALAERVRLGVHPYEALGLEVEAIAGDWDVVRVLRATYPLGPGQDLRRVCDGAAVLAAARDGALAGVPADLRTRLAPLDEVLDTYADLLVADGVHALVTGHADVANAAMEAAAGLGAPPDLRSVRTPRAATTVRSSAWVLLPGGTSPPAASDLAPVRIADPAYTALVASELGDAAVEAHDEATVAMRHRIATVLGGGEQEGPVPSLVGGSYPGLPATGDDDLHAAILTDLDARLARLADLAQIVHAAVAALDPGAPDTDAQIAAVAARWFVDLGGVPPDEPTSARQTALVTALADRLAVPPPGAVAPTEAAINALRQAIRSLAGDPSLPVLPVVARTLVPTLHAAPDLDTSWLEIVAAVRPRLAPLEARQLDPARHPWPAALATPSGDDDAWHVTGPVLAVYGPAVDQPDGGGSVALAALDAWTDSVPSTRHVTAATFGFNSPKSRAPQAVVLAVPPDRAQRLTAAGLLDVVLETRHLAHARATRPTDLGGLPYATPAPLVHAGKTTSFLDGWPQA